MDAEDEYLFHEHEEKKGKTDLSTLFKMNEIAIYVHENIVYMLTNQYEMKSIQCKEEEQIKLGASSVVETK